VQFDLRRFPVVTSTMDVGRELAEQGAPEGLVVVADEQRAGRGRAGRAWYSPPGQSLYLSLLLRPALGARQIGWLTMIGALAVLDGLAHLSSLDARLSLKWFNDVLLNGRKLAGVLVEASFVADRLDYAILGIGLNVNTCFADAPEEVRQRATSLRQAFGREFDRDDVLARLLAAFGARYQRLPASPLADYIGHLETLGRPVRLCAGHEIIEGAAVRVQEDGALVVMTAAGERVAAFGEVISG
jgi:BirA family biotin operon repressor/biotin-[acetyl-CoA-carboxylase] ligase